MIARRPPARIAGGAALLAVALLALNLLCAAYYLSVPPSPDQSIFDYIGWLATRGAVFYRDAFEISWPGPLLYHALGVALFGVHEWTARATDLCLLPIGWLGIWLFCRRAGHGWGGAVAASLYTLVYVTSGAWMAGHRDIVAMHMLLCAGGLLLTAERIRWARPIAGALLGYAVTVRPTYLAMLLPLLWCAWREAPSGRGRAVAGLLLGAGAVWLGFLLYLAANGALADFVEQGLVVPVTIYAMPRDMPFMVARFFEIIRTSWAWLVVAAACGLGIQIVLRRKRRALFLIGAMAAVAILSFFVQRKGFYYHLGGLIPLLFLFAALGLLDATKAPRSRVVLLLELAAALVSTAGLLSRAKALLPVGGGKREGLAAERASIAAVIRAESGSGDTLLQMGWNYETSFLAGRATPTRFVNTIILGAIDDEPRFQPWIAAFGSELHRAPPAFILLDRGVIAQYGSFAMSRSPALQTIYAMRARYRARLTTPDMILLKRLPEAAR